MKTMVKTIAGVAAFVALGVMGCHPGDIPNPGGPAPAGKTFSVNMTDGPANYKRLDIQITGVEAYNDTRGWVKLSSEVHGINILNLANGATTNLAVTNEVYVGHYSMIRLRFSDENFVTVNAAVDITGLHLNAGATAHLKWAHENMYVDIPIDEEVSNDVGANVMLDFDAAASVSDALGAFTLDPAIKDMKDLMTGTRGIVSGGDAAAFITLSNGRNTYTAYSTFEGRFFLRGMEEGHYMATIKVMKRNPDTGLMEERAYVMDDVSVTKRSVTDMGTIRF